MSKSADISKEKGSEKGESSEASKTETGQYEEVSKIIKDLGIDKAIKGAVTRGVTDISKETSKRLPRMTKFERNVNAIIKLIPWLVLLIGSIYSLHLVFQIIRLVIFGI